MSNLHLLVPSCECYRLPLTLCAPSHPSFKTEVRLVVCAATPLSWIGDATSVTGDDTHVPSFPTGPIPTTIGNLTSLDTLIIGAGITGTIPTEIGKLTDLTQL